MTLSASGAFNLRIMALTPMHGIGGRQDLPLPFELVVAGAATAVIASFLVLSLAWRAARPAGSGLLLGEMVTRIVDSAGPALDGPRRRVIGGAVHGDGAVFR